MKYFNVALILTITLLVACNNNGISTGKEGKKVFTYKPLSWQMEVPEEWNVLTETERMKLAYKAENYYEESPAGQQEEKEIILGVRKAEENINAIYAFTRKYKKNEDPPNLADLLAAQYKSYSKGDYNAYKSITEENISGIRFDKAVLSVRYKGKPYFTYTTYSTMLGNLNFGVSITADNNSDEELLINNFEQSISTLKY